MEYTIVLNEPIAVSLTLFAIVCVMSCASNFRLVSKTSLENYELLFNELSILKRQNEEIIERLNVEGSCEDSEGCLQSNCCNVSKSIVKSEISDESQDSESEQESVATPITQNVLYYETENIVNELTPNVSESQQNIPIKHSGKFDEKHKQLMAKLEQGKQVHVSYHKTTFNAVYEVDDSAPHGYVFKTEHEIYYTPSQFSLAKKQALNPDVTADNGWDSVYIIAGKTEKNKDNKKSLNSLIAT